MHVRKYYVFALIGISVGGEYVVDGETSEEKPHGPPGAFWFMNNSGSEWFPRPLKSPVTSKPSGDSESRFILNKDSYNLGFF